MSLDIRTVGAQPLLVLGGAGCMLLLKLLVVTGLARAFLNWANSLHTGLLLGPGGEFAFVIVSVASGERLLAPNDAQITLFITAVTMATIPLLSRLGGELAPRLAPKMRVDPSILVPQVSDALPRVIIAGFGRVGQTVAAMLEVHKVPYVDDPASADELVATARREREDLLIIARARDAAHAAHLYRIGASDAVPETIEASLQLSEAVLVDVGVPMGPVIASIHEKRAALQAGMKAMAPEADVRMLGRRRLRDRS